MNRPREFDDTREHLLATGEAVIRGKGFAGVGLSEILAEAGVPKGSFYHYFRSKEGFGTDMLVRYFERYDQELQHLLLEGPGRGRLRLINYFRRWAARHGDADAKAQPLKPQCQQACLAVKLSAEVSDMSESMREALVAGMQRIQQRLAQTIVIGQQDGSLNPQLTPDALAESLYQLWVGAELLTKVQRSPAPLQRALQQTELWLQGPAQG